jgi:hypothetical protein
MSYIRFWDSGPLIYDAIVQQSLSQKVWLFLLTIYFRYHAATSFSQECSKVHVAMNTHPPLVTVFYMRFESYKNSICSEMKVGD